ncbi:CoA transferase [Acerihabitans sp. TG2]|uniref:CoA transferase n=1 Tax=Acerihabitans sp. TG2 TaxID=3096008 RepID=UPI002B22ED86|nr:CoA transferase [Acerihabitans sp. TG2]MEA9393390.1 CoA transferase [Acerihabitans sp. TG2]
MNRREMLKLTGGAIATSFLASNKIAIAQTNPLYQTNEPINFSIDSAFTELMQGIGSTPQDGGGKAIFTGSDPILRSHFRIGTSMALPAMAAGVGAAAIWKMRTGQEQDVRVDLREAVYNVNPLLTPIMQHRIASGRVPVGDIVPKSFTFTPTINDRLYQAPLGIGNPFSFVPFQTKDGRYVNITGAYPHLSDSALRLLGVSPERNKIAKAIQQWDANVLEDAMVEKKVIGVIHRSKEEWLKHPEGNFLANVPLIDIRKIGDSDPIPFTSNPQQPLSGIKGLALTHVIAGSCASRTLAEYGADILHVTRDQSFEHEAIWTDVNVGMRSTLLDLKQSAQAATLNALLPDADVFIESFSGRGIERLGFGVEEVTKQRPGIIYLTVRCYSWDGPWQNRGGFDMEALAVSGYTMAEGGHGKPEIPPNFPGAIDEVGTKPLFPPTLVLNDYIAGYLGAAGVIAALRRRAVEGGSYHVSISLTRAAMWYQTLGRFPTTDFDATHPDHRMIPPETVRANTAYGELYRLAPLAKLSASPSHWRSPLLIVRGSDRPEW